MVRRSAPNVRPILPGRPAVRGTFARLVAGGETGAKVGAAAGHGATGRSAKNAATALRLQLVRSAPSTEWPTRGTTSIWAPGMRAATCRALSTGVRRSPPPSSTSVGTAGSGPTGPGGGEAAGHPMHSELSPDAGAV